MQYYLNLRQQSFLKSIQKSYDCLLMYGNHNRLKEKRLTTRIPMFKNFLIKQYRLFERLQKEIDDNSKRLSRFISVIFTMSTAVITYVSYLLFMIPQTFVYQFLYMMAALALIATLSQLIIGCAKIRNNNQKLLRLKHKYIVHSSCEYKNNFTIQQLFKV